MRKHRYTRAAYVQRIPEASMPAIQQDERFFEELSARRMRGTCGRPLGAARLLTVVQDEMDALVAKRRV